MAGFLTKAVAITATASVVLAGCQGNDRDSNDRSSRPGAKGGTLTYYVHRRIEHLDPQRTYVGRDITNWRRTVYRSWVTFPISEDVGISTTYVPDLATDTGTSDDGARTWKFTVRDGVTWEDGRPITCADFKYGASRVFATDVITGGPNYLLSYLDIPQDPKTNMPIYTGPYESSAAGRAAFDKAITCDGNTITYHFKKPWADFPLAIAALHMMDPYRADKDRGDDSNFQIFSNGPYRLAGAWDQQKGGTLIRNEHYDPSTDSPDNRQAKPDRIVFDAGKSVEEITERLIADRGEARTAVTDERIPTAYYRQITGEVAERAVTVPSPYVDYLVLNFTRLTNLRVRQALAAALDVTAWVAAGGGDQANKEATDLVNPVVMGYQEGLFPGGSGDPETAKELLESAGVDTPYPLTFTYPENPTLDEQARALEEGWEKAGFAVTLDSVPDAEYFPTIAEPGLESDVILAGWGADWPSAITVTPPLFDSRPNLTEDSNGQNYGAYRSAEFEALVDEAQRAADLDTQTKLLQQADQVLADDVAYLPLGVAMFSLLRGSHVTGYMNTAASSSYPDLGPIGVR